MEMSSMPSEQHLPYRSTADVVVLDGDGSRWVREDVILKSARLVLSLVLSLVVARSLHDA